MSKIQEVGTKMVTRAKSSGTKLKLSSKKTGEKILAEKKKSAAGNNTPGREEGKKNKVKAERPIKSTKATPKEGSGVPPKEVSFGVPAKEGSFGVPPKEVSFGVPAKEGSFGVPPKEVSFGVPAKEGSFGVPPKEVSFGVPAKEGSFGVPPKEGSLGLSVSGHSKNRTKKRPKKKVQYEMDCADVNNIDIIALRNYLRDHLKVANRKNNKCLKVVVRGMTVVVKSSVFMAKKCLRSVTYRYLDHQKITTVHVRCETPTSYKLISGC